MTPEQRARRSADAMWANDAASQALGMHINEISPGRAVLSMQVRPDHLNGLGICHGGFIFTLADSAFAFACNTANQLTVAQENQITFLAPGQPDERLTATAQAQAQAGRTGVYDVRVTGEDGRTVALMRGLSRTIKGAHFDEDDEDKETQDA